MNIASRPTRQPVRRPWSREELIRGRNIALGLATDISSQNTYASHLNSYIAFCSMHSFLLDPTPNTLSFFVVYMSHHIEPRSVGSYLSGVCNHLETFFPDARQNRNAPLVKKTLAGMKKLRSKPVRRKQPLTRKHLLNAESSITTLSTYDNILFALMLITGTCGLLRLGELTLPNNPAIRNLRKLTQRSSVELIDHNGFSFWLPYHKADRLFEGNRIVILPKWNLHPLRLLQLYLPLRDGRFPFHPHLWLTSTGSVPTRSWFMRRLRAIEPDSRWAGQSMHAGGATAMAEDGAPPQAIQAAGRWASDTFQIYIRKNPFVLNAMLATRRQ